MTSVLHSTLEQDLMVGAEESLVVQICWQCRVEGSIQNDFSVMCWRHT